MDPCAFHLRTLRYRPRTHAGAGRGCAALNIFFEHCCCGHRTMHRHTASLYFGPNANYRLLILHRMIVFRSTTSFWLGVHFKGVGDSGAILHAEARESGSSKW